MPVLTICLDNWAYYSKEKPGQTRVIIVTGEKECVNRWQDTETWRYRSRWTLVTRSAVVRRKSAKNKEKYTKFCYEHSRYYNQQELLRYQWRIRTNVIDPSGHCTGHSKRRDTAKTAKHTVFEDFFCRTQKCWRYQSRWKLVTPSLNAIAQRKTTTFWKSCWKYFQ